MVALFGNLLTGCRSCDDRRVDDISKVPGIYEGQAQIIVPENLKRFVPDSLKGALDKPVDAKLRIQENDKGELTLELVDFTMPLKDMKLQPASCEASEDGEAFNLNKELSSRIAVAEKHVKIRERLQWGLYYFEAIAVLAVILVMTTLVF